MKKRRKRGLGNIQEKVKARLDEKQRRKEYKDIGDRVGGSKKELAAYRIIQFADLVNIEQDQALAETLVTKDRVYPEVNVPAEKERGVSSGVVFLKTKIRAACFNKPKYNNPLERSIYVKFLAFYLERLEKCYVRKDVIELASFLKYVWPETMGKEIIELFLNANNDPDFFEKNDNFKGNGFYNGKQVYTYRYFDNKAISRQESSTEQFSKYAVSKISAQSIERVFGTSFWNMITFQTRESDAVKENYYKAAQYEGVSQQRVDDLLNEAIGYLALLTDEKNNDIAYVSALNDESQIEDAWRRHYPVSISFRSEQFDFKSLDEVKQAILVQIEARYARKLEAQELKIKSIKETVVGNDWSWYEGKLNEKKTVEKSGEPTINTGIPLAHIRRTGGLEVSRKMVADATETDLSKNPITSLFGFKSVQFGQSLKDVESREQIRHFMGAVADLGEVLNIDIKALNQKGGLSMAFAARGGGSKAMAFYEVRGRIINLTKSRGDGTVCHEWGHYLDHTLSGGLGDNWAATDGGSAYYNINQKLRRLIGVIKTGNADVTKGLVVRYEAVNSGVWTLNGEKIIPHGSPQETFAYWQKRSDYFKELKAGKTYVQQVKIIGSLIKQLGLPYYDYEFPYFPPNGSNYLQSCQKMKSSYWTMTVELFARAFEAYVLDKLSAAGRYNNYLVSENYQRFFQVKSGETISVYPQGEERKYFNRLFDELFEAIKSDFGIGDFVPFTSVRVNEDEATVQVQKEGKQQKETNTDSQSKQKALVIAKAKIALLKVKLKLALALAA